MLVMEGVIETKASTILQFIHWLSGSLHVTLEEGTWVAWLYDLLKPHVTKIVVCNPRRNALLKEGSKSDRIDARKMFDLLRSNFLRPHEALQNAVKLSGARHFEVELRGASDRIQLTIRDYGVGFDPDEAMMNNRGLGLISMRERISLVWRTFSVTSKPQWGTEINIRVPLSAGAGMAQAAG
jgi:hypothetical protein